MVTEEDIKKRMIERRLQEMQLQAQQQEIQQEQVMEAVKKIIHQILDNNARERLSNLRLVKPELAFQLEVYLAQLYEAGQIRGMITDEQLVTILKKMGTKDFKIKRK
jgi:programmed cell death protein 5